MRGLMCAVAALAITGAGAGAFAQDASTAEQAGPAAQNSAMAYVTAAGQSDQFEIQEGKIAASMGQSPKVRAFGKQMIEDHQKSTRMVMAAALQSGLPEMPPPPLRPDQQQMIAQLQSTSGPAFDRMYVQQQLQSHQQALNLQQSYSRGGGDPNLRGAATKIVPVVQHHLGELESMQAGM
jgi:putative membrane protein